MKPGKNDIKLQILITGEELYELQEHTYLMAESFGLDTRIANYKGKRPIGLYNWDFECLISVIEYALDDPKSYPDKSVPGYTLMEQLLERLRVEERKF